MQTVASFLIRASNNLPDIAHQLYLERPLHDFNADLQQRLFDLGTELLAKKVCQSEEYIVGAWVGQIIDYIGDDCPPGTLPCDGTDYLIDDYPELMEIYEGSSALFETMYNQPTTGRFRTPNLAGRSLVGHGTLSNPYYPTVSQGGSYSKNQGGGEETHTLTVDEIPTHSHSRLGTTSGAGAVNSTAVRGGAGAANYTSTSSVGGGEQHENRSPYFAVNKCIVARVINPVPENFRLRQNPMDPCELQQTFNGGDYWSLAFDYDECEFNVVDDGTDIINEIIETSTEIDNSVVIYNGDVTNINNNVTYGDGDDANRDMALCFAIDLFVDHMAAIIQKVEQDELDAQGDLLGSFSDIIGGISGIIGLASIPAIGLLNPLVGGLTAISLGVSSVLSLFAQEYVNGLDVETATEQEKADITCCMYSAMSGQTISKSLWSTSLDGCSFAPLENKTILADAISQFLQSDDIFVSFVKMYSDVIEYTIAGVILPCSCEVGVESFFVNALGTPVSTTLISQVGTDYELTVSGTYRFAFGGGRRDPAFSTGNDWATQTPIVSVEIDSATLASQSYDASHEYVWTVPGTGSAFQCRIWDTDYNDNAQGLTFTWRAL